MISILVISPDEAFLKATESQLRDDDRKFFCHTNLEEAENLLQSGIFDFCIVDVARWQEPSVARLGAIKRACGRCEFVAVADSLPEEGLDLAHNSGIDRVVPRSLQPTLLESIIARRSPRNRPMPLNPPPPSSPLPPHGHRLSFQNLDLLRDVSRILSHSLDLHSLVHHFVLKVREIIGVNRIAIFLEDPKASSPASANMASTRLQCICSIGVPADVQNCVELSKRSGIGRWVTQTGQILRAEQAPSLFSPSEVTRVQHEFELMNCQVAIPVNDRERTLGVALLGGHLTRISFSDDELQLMFHLMEELGLSVKNSWLHSELTASHKLFSDVLGSLQSGSLVVGPDLEVLHANPAMIRFLRGEEGGGRPFMFSHLPAEIRSRVHEVVEKGATVEPFTYEEAGGRLYRVSLIPFRSAHPGTPQPAMVVLEDFTQIEQAKEVAIEAANLKLTNTIAKRFAHEIRNSLVPLTTHLQLLDDQYDEAPFRESLKSALSQETARIARFTEQMLFLAEPKFPPATITPVEKLLREGFAQAQSFLQTQAILTVNHREEADAVRCHAQALRHAFQEIFLNSIQSSPAPAQLVVDITAGGQNGTRTLTIGFRDSGPGFSDETARRATEPFYTTRNTGVGLGLTVARKVAHDLGGSLEALPRHRHSPFDVVIMLPSTPAHE